MAVGGWTKKRQGRIWELVWALKVAFFRDAKNKLGVF